MKTSEWKIVIIVSIVFMVGFYVGYEICKNNVRYDAINAGVAHFVTINKDNPYNEFPHSEFQWITNTVIRK